MADDVRFAGRLTRSGTYTSLTRYVMPCSLCSESSLTVCSVSLLPLSSFQELRLSKACHADEFSW